jgi:uncharacterized Zn-binding protein involved in type VI secretion
MARNVIVVGDTLAPFGGQVIAGSPVDKVQGRAMARVGDPVRCNEHGPSAIAEGASSFQCAGLPVALEGHHTQCGCTLISLQPTLAVS